MAKSVNLTRKYVQEKGFVGFSWTTAFFGPFVPLIRGDLKWFFLYIGLAFVTGGLFTLVFPFVYNKYYTQELIDEGFEPADEKSEMLLEEYGIRFFRSSSATPNVNIVVQAGAVVATSEKRQHNINPVNHHKATIPSSISEETKKTYEPVIGIETTALIKRAFLFLEDGEIYNSERYIEQALNQDPENSQVYMAKLMIEYRVKSPVELLNKLNTPLENEKLFQRALRFADGEYKSQLEGLAQASRDMLEQERIRTEKEEADKKAHQKVLMLETKEKYYQEAVLNWQKAQKPDEIQAVITRFEKLKGYKDADELLSDAREDLAEAKKRKWTKGIIAIVAVNVLVWGGIAFVISYSDAKREEARSEEQARLQTSSTYQEEYEALHHYVEQEMTESARQAIKEHDREYELFLELKYKQNLYAQYAQGESYLNAKNYSQALEIFRQLSNQGYAPAQDKLGWMYQNGWGVEQSYTQAVSWYRKAAEQGNTEAMASMGLMYYRGWGVTRDYDTALEWYSKAAAQGSEVAQRRINSIQLLKQNRQKIALIERNKDYPVPGTIFAETLSVRPSPNTKSRAVKTLKTGHPVSVSKATEADNDYWFYITTASGTEGWVLGGYVNLIDRDLSYQEINNRKHSLPASGYITTREDSLNLRNIPTVKGSQVVEKLESGTYFTAYEVFAGDTVDWYRIRTTEGDEGWVSGKYIELY